MIQRIFSTLEFKKFNVTGTRMLRVVLGLVLLHRAVSEYRYSDFLYSSQGASSGSSVNLLGMWLGSLMDQMFYSSMPWLVSALWFVGGLSLLFNRWIKAGIIACIIAYLMAEARTVVQDGGDNIARITLCYMLLLDFSLGLTSRFRNAMHNIGVIAIYLQLIILYSVAGLSKVQGEYWVNGTALYYIQNVEWFSTNIPLIIQAFKNPWIVTISSYAAMLYMIGFPFMLFSRFHLIWAALGISFHLAIAVSMGLIDFSLIMIGLIMFTITDSEYRMINSWYESLAARFQGSKSRISNESIVDT